MDILQIVMATAKIKISEHSVTQLVVVLLDPPYIMLQNQQHLYHILVTMAMEPQLIEKANFYHKSVTFFCKTQVQHILVVIVIIRWSKLLDVIMQFLIRCTDCQMCIRNNREIHSVLFQIRQHKYQNTHLEYP